MAEGEILDERYRKTRDYTRHVIEQAITDPDLPLLEWHLAVAEKDLKYLSLHLEESGGAITDEERDRESQQLELMWDRLGEAQGLQAQRHQGALQEHIKHLREKNLNDPNWVDKFRK